MSVGVWWGADAVLERGEKIELLVDKSEMLSKEAVRFKRQVGGRTTGGHTPFSYSSCVGSSKKVAAGPPPTTYQASPTHSPFARHWLVSGGS